MALRHIKDYYNQVESVYFEMRGNIKEFDKSVKDGFLSEEQLLQAKEEISTIEENYRRLTYIIYLFNIPNRRKKDKKYRQRKDNKEIEQYLNDTNSSQKSVVLECKDSLKNFKELLKKFKETNKEKIK